MISMYALVKLLCFAVCFFASFYALSAVKFETFCRVNNPGKVKMLLFLLCLVLAYLSSEAIISITYMNGL